MNNIKINYKFEKGQKGYEGRFWFAKCEDM